MKVVTQSGVEMQVDRRPHRRPRPHRRRRRVDPTIAGHVEDARVLMAFAGWEAGYPCHLIAPALRIAPSTYFEYARKPLPDLPIFGGRRPYRHRRPAARPTADGTVEDVRVLMAHTGRAAGYPPRVTARALRIAPSTYFEYARKPLPDLPIFGGASRGAR